MKDQEILTIIQKETLRQTEGLELIASENYVSKDVLEAMGSILTNKYAEGLPSKRYYGGCEFVDQIEQLAIDRLKTLFGAEWANVQPHSGAQANAAVMLGCINPGDTILGFDLAHGGHLTHGSPVNFSGKIYRPTFYGVHPDTGLIDYDAFEKTALKEKPKLIIAGASSYSRDWNYKKMREVANEIGAVLMADISHPAGLIAKKLLTNPLEHCHFATSTTHKTLRGPRGGIIMAGKNAPNPMGIKTSKGLTKRIGTVLDSAVFPGTQGGPLEHVIAGKAVAFKEALDASFETYMRQVVSNAKKMADLFVERGYVVISGGTDNHCILIDLSNKNITGKQAEEALGKAEITVNKNMVPFDQQPPMITSGMRLGTPAITTRGLKEKDMETVVELIDKVLMNHQDLALLNETKNQVKSLVGHLPIYA